MLLFFVDPYFTPELNQLAKDMRKQSWFERNKVNKALDMDAVLSYYVNSFNPIKETLNYCDSVIEVSRNDNRLLDVYFNAMGNKGYLCILMGQYEEGINIVNEVLDWRLPRNDSGNVSNCYMYLYEACYLLGLYEQGLEYIKKVNQYLPHNFMNDPVRVNIEVITGIANIQLYVRDNNRGYGNKAEEIFKKIIYSQANKEYLSWVSYVYAHLAWKKYTDKDYDAAIKMADSAFLPRYFEEDPNKAATAMYANLFKGLSLLHTDKKAEGRKLLQKIFASVADTFGLQSDYHILSYCAYGLYEDAKDNDNFGNALDYYIKYQAARDSLDLIKNRGIVFEVNQRYNFQKKQAEISSLRSEHTIDLREKNIMLLILIAIIILLFALYKQRQLKQLKAQNAYEEEKRKVEEIIYSQDQKILQEKTKAIAEQRLLISRDMHDGLSSSLAGLAYLVNARKIAVAQSHEKETLAEIEKEVRGIYTKARAYMHDLNNSASEINYGITDFIQSLSKLFSEGKFHIKTEVDMQEVESLLNITQQNQLYMVLKEAITNTMKYAEASQMTICIEFLNNICLFNVTDNGKGIDTGREEGLGLKSMRQRIVSLGGEINITDTNPGTKISGSFPLNKQANQDL